MKIFAHRGYTKKGDTENTLEAFESAIAEKMCIELDVRLTKDGVPIVFHDASLKRMTNNNSKLADINYGELKDIKMKTGEAIPSLKETLELVNGRTLLLIELKTAKKGFTNHRLEKAVIEILKDYSGEYMLQAFNYFTVKYCKRKLKRIKTGRLSSNHYGSGYCGDFVNYKLKHLDGKKVEKFRKKGIEVYGWTGDDGNTGKSLEKAVLLGLDGIIL